MSTDEAMEIILANSLRCERMAARISTKACAARAEWDSNCAGCGRNSRALKDYGQHKCVCGRLVKKEEGLCEACYRDAHPYRRTSIANKRPVVKTQEAAKESVVAETKSEAVKGCKESRAGDRQAKACKCCGVRTRIAARGLGVGCYKREKTAGTLDANFPALMPGRVSGVKGKTPKGTAKCEGCGKDFEKTAKWQDLCQDCVKAKLKEIQAETEVPGAEPPCSDCGLPRPDSCTRCRHWNLGRPDVAEEAEIGAKEAKPEPEARELEAKAPQGEAEPLAHWSVAPGEDIAADARAAWARLKAGNFIFTGSIVAILADDRDLALAHRIEESAIEHRRSVNQHVLYLLEQGLKAVGG